MDWGNSYPSPFSDAIATTSPSQCRTAATAVTWLGTEQPGSLHQGGLRELCEPLVSHRHAPTMISSKISAANTIVKYVRMVRNCRRFRRSAITSTTRIMGR